MNKKLTSKDKENNGTDVAIAVAATKVRAKKTSKKLGWKEIDLLQRETAFKVLGFKEVRRFTLTSVPRRSSFWIHILMLSRRSGRHLMLKKCP